MMTRVSESNDWSSSIHYYGPAVQPVVMAELTLAPFFMSQRAASTCVFSAAVISAVHPGSVLEFTKDLRSLSLGIWLKKRFLRRKLTFFALLCPTIKASLFRVHSTTNH